MSYVPTEWKTGDVITANKLNHMETEIANEIHWVDGDIITADKLNSMERRIGGEFEPWVTDEIITANRLNNMEQRIYEPYDGGDKPFSEMSWDEIIGAVKSGKYQSFTVGESKTFVLNDEEIYMQIAGIDTDNKTGGGKASLSFIAKYICTLDTRINPSRTPDSPPYNEGTGSIGGWKDSEIREYLNTTLYAMIPDVIRAHIVPVNKVTDTFNTSGELVKNDITSDKIWLVSAGELNITGHETDGVVYSDLFSNANSRKKTAYNDSTKNWWWCRTPYSQTTWSYIKNDGDLWHYGVQHDGPIVFGFCL